MQQEPKGSSAAARNTATDKDAEPAKAVWFHLSDDGAMEECDEWDDAEDESKATNEEDKRQQDKQPPSKVITSGSSQAPLMDGGGPSGLNVPHLPAAVQPVAASAPPVLTSSDPRTLKVQGVTSTLMFIFKWLGTLPCVKAGMMQALRGWSDSQLESFVGMNEYLRGMCDDKEEADVKAFLQDHFGIVM